ncbi:MAG: CoA-disulfide reductase, partial [Hyphomicrobiales bacterium]|nr:CoA-disulfide reductase [Hyphomicrobiales bacterium]
MKIVIIGGVAAGMSAAAKAKRMAKDAKIVVYEKTDVVSYGACGLPYFIGDFFSNKNRMVARTAEQFEESGIEVKINHEIIGVNVHTKTVLVSKLATREVFEDSYDQLMIATGASPIIPPIENVSLENVYTLKSIEDGIRIKEAVMDAKNKEVVVIGAGFIGIELVEAIKKSGKNVHLIQLDERILPDSFDQEITDIMEKELASHGVHLHLKETVKALKGDSKVTGVITDEGAYQADVVIISTGVRPNTAFLQNTGIEMLKNGAIIINEFGQTNLENVYAAGDCATVYHLIKEENVYIPLATTANKIGRIIG